MLVSSFAAAHRLCNILSKVFKVMYEVRQTPGPVYFFASWHHRLGEWSGPARKHTDLWHLIIGKFYLFIIVYNIQHPATNTEHRPLEESIGWFRFRRALSLSCLLDNRSMAPLLKELVSNLLIVSLRFNK